MTDEYSGLTGKKYNKKDHIKSGGEGGVYNTDDPNQVMKIYNIAKPNADIRMKNLEKKIHYMIYHPVPAKLKNGRVIVPWPQDALYENDQFVGYVMPKVSDAKPIFLVNRGGKEAKKVIPDYNWKMAVKVASNLAYVVNYLHDRNIVIGDMNSDNILVYPDGLVAIIDTDSFDIRDQLSGEHYRCTVGTSEYLPPELQGRNLSGPKAEFTKESDNFALAVHIFQLLMNNTHPFNARVITDYKESMPESKQDYNISVGNCPCIRKINNCERPVGAPNIESLLPDNLIIDFRKTFDYHLTVNDPNYYLKLKLQESGRTPADVWSRDLKALYGNLSLVQCSRNPEHYYLLEKKECALCKTTQKSIPASSRPASQITQTTSQTSASNPSKNSTFKNLVIAFLVIFCLFLVGLVIGLNSGNIFIFRNGEVFFSETNKIVPVTQEDSLNIEFCKDHKWMKSYLVKDNNHRPQKS